MQNSRCTQVSQLLEKVVCWESHPCGMTAFSKRRREVGAWLSRQSACSACSEPQVLAPALHKSGVVMLATQEVEAEGPDI